MNKAFELDIITPSQAIYLPPGEKIVPKSQYAKTEKIAQLTKETKKAAELYRQEVANECEIIKKQSADDGFREGLEKLSGMIIHFDEKTQALREEFQNQILQVALTVLKKFLSEQLKIHPEWIAPIVMQALKPITQHHHVTIYINKKDKEFLEKEKDEIVHVLKNVETFSIEVRNDITEGSCEIVTEAGMVKANTEDFLRAVENQFKTIKNRPIS
jgi:flagellar biosynthesis/type III secretory pathway protein FliH